MTIKQSQCKRCGAWFDGEKPEDLCDECEPKPVTIHDQAREQFELAMTYAEDGALGTAATILQEIANSYDKRAREIRSMGYGNYVKRGGRG